jgi:hypothetical protein
MIKAIHRQTRDIFNAGMTALVKENIQPTSVFSFQLEHVLRDS